MRKKSVKIVFPNWKSSTAHIAQETMTCAGYGETHHILPGGLYTLHKPAAASYHYAQHPFCRVCIPFQELEKTWLELHDEYKLSPHHAKDVKTYKKNYGDTL